MPLAYCVGLVPGAKSQSQLYNVMFAHFEFLPTELAETHLKIYVLIYHLPYICPSFIGWKENMIFEETVRFRAFQK